MKATTTIIIAAALALQVNVLFADIEKTSSAPVKTESITINMTLLAPITPKEATFEDAVVMDNFTNLAPSVPAEASFDDMSFEMVSALSLAPVTPAVADFDDTADYNSLAPVMPAEADFE
jgi:hypothetical protein